MRIKSILILVMVIAFSVNAFGEKSMVNFSNSIRPLIVKMKNSEKQEDYENIIIYCNSIIDDKGTDYFVKAMALYWRAEAYNHMVLKGMLTKDYINNAKLDVVACLKDTPFMPECYLPAITIYYIEGDINKMELTMNKALSLMDDEYASRANSFNGEEISLSAYRELLTNRVMDWKKTDTP